MPPLPPTPLLVLADVVGLALALPRVGRPTSPRRLAAEAFAVGVPTCAGFAAAWALYRWVEQRW